jgi:REP element-mobilizing transposase RayT
MAGANATRADVLLAQAFTPGTAIAPHPISFSARFSGLTNMGHAFHQLYYHIIWATHRRDPHLHRSYRTDFLAILNEEVRNKGGISIRHNCMPDHVHLLVRLPPTVRLSEFIGQVKGATAFRFRVNREIKPQFKLQWQEGYGVMSLRKDEVPKVSGYIDNQEMHHGSAKLSELLETIEIDVDDYGEIVP